MLLLRSLKNQINRNAFLQFKILIQKCLFLLKIWQNGESEAFIRGTESILQSLEVLLWHSYSFCNRYIEENYSKIRNVERELASLAFEVKLTAGPKKAGDGFSFLYDQLVFIWVDLRLISLYCNWSFCKALEHLRKKIEISGEKIKVARQKEEQAKKVWWSHCFIKIMCKLFRWLWETIISSYFYIWWASASWLDLGGCSQSIEGRRRKETKAMWRS